MFKAFLIWQTGLLAFLPCLFSSVQLYVGFEMNYVEAAWTLVP
jgi:hypothetical protein